MEFNKNNKNSKGDISNVMMKIGNNLQQSNGIGASD